MAWTRTLAAVAVAACLAGAPALGQQGGQPVSVEYGNWTPSFALAQHRALGKALDALQPRVPGRRNVYIVSAALYGQHVFEHEAAGAADVLSAHFHAAGHAIVLSNYHPGLDPSFPAATGSNFETALGRVAELMDKENDVVVIFITSHGGQNTGIAGFEPIPGAGMQPLVQSELLPGRLRGALDAAGIKNRIIILSACFSGQFIPTLQDPNTIVLTAASAERTSFGCQAENDWTYFGDAMFAKSLPQSGSLLTAFDNAKKQISAAESQANLTPSQPQMFVGAQAAKVLAEIEK